MERREFIKTGCGYCTALASFSVLGTLLEGCKPSDLIYKTEPAEGIIRVPVALFQEKKYLVIRTRQIDYDILLVKDTESSFHSLAMECTHRQQPLVVTSTGLVCNEHGSRFDLDGNVLLDPATKPLMRFRTDLAGSEILIYQGRPLNSGL